ncbi:penicillin-binding transpeptidase domain-containing protein [Amycolatopsis plumensis]|uniref:penicillin-binding transpeptidase domain-containing protein n=1 Tax=Amycolatopsis plumensis TaxID=236508 RepID=UPI0036233B8C
MLGQYAPGSTFKIVDSLAMIRNGMTPDSTVECTPTISVDGRTFKNAEGYPVTSLGSIALRDAFAIRATRHSSAHGTRSAKPSSNPRQLPWGSRSKHRSWGPMPSWAQSPETRTARSTQPP